MAIFALLTLLALATRPLPAQGAYIRVTDFVDDAVINGTCTLREAIRSANTNTSVDACQSGSGVSTDTIAVPAGVHSVDLSGGNNEDNGLTGDLDVTSNLVIAGAAPGFTVIDGTGGNPDDRLLHIASVSAGVTIEGLTLRGGNAVNAPFPGGGVVYIQSGSVIMRDVEVREGVAAGGGGIFSDDVLELERSRVVDNMAVESGGGPNPGGGIYQGGNAAELNIRDSEISGNEAHDFGGGIASIGGSLGLRRSRILDNTAGSFGGGLVVATNDFVVEFVEFARNEATQGGGVWNNMPGEIRRSAFIDNEATVSGGGWYDEGAGISRFSTFTGNISPEGAGVHANASMTLLDSLTIARNTGPGVTNAMGAFLENTLIAENSGGNCTGVAPAFGAFNLEDTNSCGFVASAMSPNFPNTAPLLGALGDYGGPTPTIALLAGSPAIDAVSSEIRMNCEQMLDQRGHSRGRPRTQNAQDQDVFLCDIGAFEHTTPFVVDSLLDAVDADPADDVCLTAGATCTLRAAIQQANAIYGDHVIELGPGTHLLSIPGTGEDVAATGDLDIDPPLQIRGAGVGVSTVDGGGIDRVFDVVAPVHVQSGVERTSIEDLTITGGDAGSENGGGIRVQRDPLYVERVELSSNTAMLGGAIWAVGGATRVSLLESTVSENTGGMALYIGDAEIERSTLSGNTNTLTGNGGAGEFFAVRFTNSTVSGNHGDGTGAFFAGQAIVDHSTIYDNTANFAPGGVFLLELSAFRNSILASNTVSGVSGNCSFNDGAIVSLGNNLTDTSASDCGFSQPGDLVDTDPLLLALADNGGPTLTHLPDTGSDALDTGDDTTCLPIDQRGVPRPLEGDDMGDPHCDIGSVEAPEPAAPLLLAAGIVCLRGLAKRRDARRRIGV